MTLNKKYFDLMDHFGSTCTVDEMWSKPEKTDLIALRHDIDHSLDVALEMAFWEHERGLKATYYLLNSTPYWDDPQFDVKVKQLLAFGHEVGLHFNSIANWLAGRAHSPKEDYMDALGRLRALGGNAKGAAAHGDRLCYTHGAPNFWMFASEDPLETSDTCLSAEGIPVTDSNYQILRPPSDVLVREDGETTKLWANTLEECETEFLAHRVNWDRYYTDSGGNWTRSPDPMTVPDIASGRTMILVHPIHWRAPPRQVFVLSPARSGSTWLANMTESATNARGLHETTLNARLKDGGLVPEKRTDHQIDALVANDEEVAKLLSERRDWFDQSKDDVLECNVYLPLVTTQLRQLNDDASYVSLRRNPEQILLSLYNRGWYETEDDSARPTIPGTDWGSLSQVEKIAHYIRYCRAQAELTPDVKVIELDKITSDINALASFYRSIGLAFYPLLAKPIFGEKRNAGKFNDISHISQLSEADQESIARLLPNGSAAGSTLNALSVKTKTTEKQLEKYRWTRLPWLRSLACLPSSKKMTYKMGRASVEAGAPAILQIGLRGLGRKKRTLAAPRSNTKFDIPNSGGTTFLLDIKNLKLIGHWQLAITIYDAVGDRLEFKRLEARLSEGSQDWRFRVRASGVAFRIALSAPVAEAERELSFREITLRKLRKDQEVVKLEPALFKENVGLLLRAPIRDPQSLTEDVLRLARLGFGRVTMLLSSTKQEVPKKLLDIGINLMSLDELSPPILTETRPPTMPSILLALDEQDRVAIDNELASRLERVPKAIDWGSLKSLTDDQIKQRLSQDI